MGRTERSKSSYANEESHGNVKNGAALTPAQLDPEPKGFAAMFKKWPKSTFCIVGNELCERFSYYGMRAVLTLYLLNILKFSENDSILIYHGWTVVCFLTPLFGSILADGYIGKFWTIFFVSIVYAIGNVTLSVSSTFDSSSSVHPWLDFTGLIIIGLGTGGIKPCVSSFGADQFPAHYTTMISIFFSVFYFTINFGSTMSMILTPILRTIPCMGHDSCYPMAFGIPAGLMVISTVVLMLGSPFYKKVPPKENIIAIVFKAICKAIYNKFTNSNVKREHWMDHYLDGHDCGRDEKCLSLAVKGKSVGQICAQQKFAEDCKSLVRVLVMMLPMPMFWALYDQQGSRWTLQAVAMNSELWSGFSLLPDQMATLNAVLILLFIPIFQTFVYPAFEKCGIRSTPLRRMVTGGFLAALAFTASAFVQLKVNQTLPDIPANNMAFVSVINGFQACNVTVTAEGSSRFVAVNSSLIDDNYADKHELFRFKVGSSRPTNFQFEYDGLDCHGYRTSMFSVKLYGGKTHYIATTPQGIMSGTSSLQKPQEGEGESSVSINLMLSCALLPGNVTWDEGCNSAVDKVKSAYSSRLAACEFDAVRPHCDPRNRKYYVWKEGDASHALVESLYNRTSSGTIYAEQNVKPGVYQMFYIRYKKPAGDRTPAESDLDYYLIPDVFLNIVGQGGVYTFTIVNDTTNIFNLHAVVPSNKVSILWQVPQYVILTAAEILFSITGLEFSYGQASPQLKSVVTAAFLMTDAFGNIIIIILDQVLQISNLAYVMFIFAGIMALVITGFALMSVFYYDYVDFTNSEEHNPENAADDDSCASIDATKL